MIEVTETYRQGVLQAFVTGGKQEVTITERPAKWELQTRWLRPREILIPRVYTVAWSGGRSVFTKYDDALRVALWHAKRAH